MTISHYQCHYIFKMAAIRMTQLCVAIFSLASVILTVSGHGYLWHPVARASAWRQGFDTPVDYDDNGLNCGGAGIQYQQNDGNCGECGDNWANPRPRPNEAGGTYGTGLIVANYTMGQEVNVEVNLTRNHKGHFEFRLCVNNDPGKYVDQDCLDEHVLHLSDGSGTQRPIDTDANGIWKSTILLPDGVTCTQCVFQWHYLAGNSWGDCGNGTSAVGCGNQEVFRGCSDIGIY